MIDPRYITNKNLFSVDYSGEERRAALVRLHRELDELDAHESWRNNPLIAAFQYLFHRFGMSPIKAKIQSSRTHRKAEEDR